MAKLHPSPIKGFTIVELLIVIVVIATLAAITITAYNGTQQRAQATAIADQLKKTEKGLRLFATEQGISAWWPEIYFTSFHDPALTAIIASVNGSDLKDYLSVPSTFSTWKYDNDSDTKATDCIINNNGVNILAANITDSSIASLVDNEIDDGNINCGKVRYDSTNQRIIYNLSLNENSL